MASFRVPVPASMVLAGRTLPAAGRAQARRGGREPGAAQQLVRAELLLGALRAVERELRRLVVGQPRLPALLICLQPVRLALGARRDQRDTLERQGPSLGRWGSQRRRADRPIGIWAISGWVALPKHPGKTRLKGRAASASATVPTRCPNAAIRGRCTTSEPEGRRTRLDERACRMSGRLGRPRSRTWSASRGRAS